MDVLAVKEAAAAGASPMPAQATARHPRDEDLPLSRPLDVRPGEVPHPRKKSTKMRTEHDPIDHLKKMIARERLADEDELKAIDGEVKTSWPTPRNSRRRPGTRSAELWTDILVERY